MNLLHMKYAVEIAEAKSINRASETLFVGQPTLSRAIKELEQNLGIKIFDRSAKGMFLTPDGEVFIRYAKLFLNRLMKLKPPSAVPALNVSVFRFHAPVQAIFPMHSRHSHCCLSPRMPSMRFTMKPTRQTL